MGRHKASDLNTALQPGHLHTNQELNYIDMLIVRIPNRFLPECEQT